MKVLCIDKSPRKTTADFLSLSKLVVGETYHVEGEDVSKHGNLVYFIHEIPINNGGFLASRFIPCSDIDEKEIAKERNLVCQ